MYSSVASAETCSCLTVTAVSPSPAQSADEQPSVAPWIAPFVIGDLATPQDVHRGPDVDVYLQPTPVPLVIFVHGPVSDDWLHRPKDWPVYRGYAALALASGLSAAIVDLHFSVAAFPDGIAQLDAIVARLRIDPRVNGSALGLWAFSGGALAVQPWVADPPTWLRAVALSYPLLRAEGSTAPQTADCLARQLPVILTRVGFEAPSLQRQVDEFIARARSNSASLTVVDVPHGRHGFDVLDDSDESRAAVRAAMDAMREAITYRS